MDIFKLLLMECFPLLLLLLSNNCVNFCILFDFNVKGVIVDDVDDGDVIVGCTDLLLLSYWQTTTLILVDDSVVVVVVVDGDDFDDSIMVDVN